MALPTGDMSWPPPEVDREIKRVRGFAAWYGGDVDDIPAGRDGLAPTARRIWPWARRNADLTATAIPNYGESSPVHVPVAADLARTSAALLFSRPLTFSTGDNAADARLSDIFEGVGWESMLPEAGELAAALSGMYWRVTFDRASVPDSPIPTFVQPDNAWPEWCWGRLRAVTFFRKLSAQGSSSVVWRHLERHSVATSGSTTAAVIEHGLYAGEDGRLGQRRPLEDHPETADLAPTLNTEGGIVLLGVPRTAGYIPNMRPNRADRGSPFGRPDIEQQEGLLQGVDDTWTSWLRDIRLGKGRILVPDEYLSPIGAPGQGAAFDVDREVYSTLRMMAPDNPGDAIKLIQFTIRHAEHQATIRALLQQIVTGVGYSMRAFGMGETDAAITATQVDSEDEITETTRRSKVRYWSPELQQIGAALLAMDDALGFAGATGLPAGARVAVEFPEHADESERDRAQTLLLLDQARAVSTEVKVRTAHPEWSEQQVIEETGRINREQGLPDPTAAGTVLGIPAPAGVPSA